MGVTGVGRVLGLMNLMTRVHDGVTACLLVRVESGTLAKPCHPPSVAIARPAAVLTRRLRQKCSWGRVCIGSITMAADRVQPN